MCNHRRASIYAVDYPPGVEAHHAAWTTLRIWEEDRGWEKGEKVVGTPFGAIPIKIPIAERQETRKKVGWNPHWWNSDKNTNCLKTKSGIVEKSTGVEMRTRQDRKDDGGGGDEE